MVALDSILPVFQRQGCGELGRDAIEQSLAPRVTPFPTAETVTVHTWKLASQMAISEGRGARGVNYGPGERNGKFKIDQFLSCTELRTFAIRKRCRTNILARAQIGAQRVR